MATCETLIARAVAKWGGGDSNPVLRAYESWYNTKYEREFLHRLFQARPGSSKYGYHVVVTTAGAYVYPNGEPEIRTMPDLLLAVRLAAHVIAMLNVDQKVVVLSRAANLRCIVIGDTIVIHDTVTAFAIEHAKPTTVVATLALSLDAGHAAPLARRYALMRAPVTSAANRCLAIAGAVPENTAFVILWEIYAVHKIQTGMTIFNTDHPLDAGTTIRICLADDLCVVATRQHVSRLQTVLEVAAPEVVRWQETRARRGSVLVVSACASLFWVRGGSPEDDQTTFGGLGADPRLAYVEPPEIFIPESHIDLRVELAPDHNAADCSNH
jgi:hypothetical protein